MTRMRPRLRFVTGDLRDEEAVKALFKAEAFEAVAHVAAMAAGLLLGRFAPHEQAEAAHFEQRLLRVHHETWRAEVRTAGPAALDADAVAVR